MGIVTVRTSFIQYSITYTQGRYSSQGLLEELYMPRPKVIVLNQISPNRSAVYTVFCTCEYLFSSISFMK